MEKYSNISKEALEAIENFESQFREPIRYVRRRLFVSLYALQPSAREDVLSILGEYCEKLSELLSNEEISVLQKEYREVMRYCVSSRGSIWGTKLMSLDYPIIPYQVVDLCTTIISPASGSNVLLPYSCPEMFAYLSNDCKCDGYVYDMYGYETSSEALKEWALSQIMAEVFNVDAQIRNYRFNEVKNSLQKQYDYILAFPPIRVNSNWISDELTLLAKDFLKENGEMFCFLPYEFTCKLEWENLRKTIIDACFEIKVITLCTSTYRRREICVIHLKKTRTGNIMLVDGTQLSREINFSFSSTTFEAEYLIEAIERDEGKYVWHGEAKKIEDYDLRPAIYLMKLPIPQEGERLEKMRELVELIECDNDVSDLDAECKYKVIGPMDLVSDFTHCSVGLEGLTYSKNVTSLLTCDALLFNGGGNVAKFSHKGEKVGLDRRIIPFRLKNQSIISEEFLLRALTLKETLEQVRSYERGMSVTGLVGKDFLKLVIIIPSIERQKQLVADAKTIWQIQHETVEEKNKRYYKMRWLNEEHIRDIKHNLSDDIKVFFDSLANLRYLFNHAPDGVKLSSIISKVGKTTITVKYLLDGLKSSVDKLSKDIDYLTQNESEEEEVMNVANVIDAYCDDIPKRYGVPIQVNRQLDKEIFIKISFKSISNLLDNIVVNAFRHGFEKGKDEKKMYFLVEATTEQMCRISIANNGSPISEEAINIFFEPDRFAGETGNTGYGGYKIKEICVHAGGRVLQPKNKDGYVVFSVELPLVQGTN